MKRRAVNRMTLLLMLCFLTVIPIFAQTWITVSANGYLRMLIIDPQGRRVGYDPSSGKYFSEIPDVTIGADGIGIITDDGTEDDPYEKDPIAATLYYSDALVGKFVIRLFGTKPASFDLNVIANPAGDGPATNIATGGFIDSGMVFQFEFKYDSNNRANTELKKKVDGHTLRQDLAAAYKLKLLGDRKLFDDWNKEIDKIERDLARKDSAKVRKELEKFEKEIDKQRQETIKHEEKGEKEKKRFISADAYQILKEDIIILLKQLPPGKDEKDKKGGN